MDMYAFIARAAYRNPGTAASGMFSQGGYRPHLASCIQSGPSAFEREEKQSLPIT
jgi:hypothetical protein